MGDRANIVLKEGTGEKAEQVCLYTHWNGERLPGILKIALIRGKERWDDFQYLTRIIFCEMLKQDSDGLNGIYGYGITQRPWDGAERVLIVENQKVSYNDKTYTFEEYISGDASEHIW